MLGDPTLGLSGPTLGVGVSRIQGAPRPFRQRFSQATGKSVGVHKIARSVVSVFSEPSRGGPGVSIKTSEGDGRAPAEHSATPHKEAHVQTTTKLLVVIIALLTLGDRSPGSATVRVGHPGASRHQPWVSPGSRTTAGHVASHACTRPRRPRRPVEHHHTPTTAPRPRHRHADHHHADHGTGTADHHHADHGTGPPTTTTRPPPPDRDHHSWWSRPGQPALAVGDRPSARLEQRHGHGTGDTLPDGSPPRPGDL